MGSAAASATTNVAPTVVVTNAVQRPGTTFMDIDYRVNDPDDATVQTAALGFVNGGANLSQIIKISTLVEGTAANLGTNVPANTNLHLTWNVAADWNTNFGNVQVEILAKDGRGLLPFHWITLPAHGTDPELTINDRPINDADLLPIWYWLIANGDPAVQLVNGQIFSVGGNSSSNLLAQGTSTTAFGREFLWERLNIRSLSGGEVMRANAGRYGFQAVDKYSVARGFIIADRSYAWGANDDGQAIDVPVPNITAVALGYPYRNNPGPTPGGFTLVLSGGGVTGWGVNSYGEIGIPASATNVVAIAAGSVHSLALKADGTVVGWGFNQWGQATGVPNSDDYHVSQGIVTVAGQTLSNVVAVAAGRYHSLALKADGTVVGLGNDDYGETVSPASATNVVAIAAGFYHNLALKADGTVVAWGANYSGQNTIPSSATNVVAIAAGAGHSLALKADGTVVGWGSNDYGETTIPSSATNVVAITAGYVHSLALKADGTVVVWGDNRYGQLNVPAGLSGIDLLGVGNANHIVVVDKRTP